MKRVAILVDNMFLENASKLYNAYPSDLSKLPSILLDKEEEHYKTYVFDALPWLPDNPSEPQKLKRENKMRYLTAMRYKERIVIEEGYVKPKKTTCPYCKKENIVPVQKLVDVKLSVRLVSLGWSKSVDKIILISGDADIIPAVEDIERSGVIVKLAYVNDKSVGTASGLIKVCPEKHPLTPQELRFLHFDKPIVPTP